MLLISSLMLSMSLRLLWPRVAVVIASTLWLASAGRADPTVGVAVLHSVAWSPGDSVREGAGEFEVLLRVAQLQRTHHAAGLVTVGDHNGMLSGGGERALRQVSLSGVPVAKLARNGEVAATPDGVFLDAGHLAEDQVTHVLAHCLEKYGAPPSAADPMHPTNRELLAIREHLRPFQQSLAVAAGSQVAVR